MNVYSAIVTGPQLLHFVKSQYTGGGNRTELESNTRSSTATLFVVFGSFNTAEWVQVSVRFVSQLWCKYETWSCCARKSFT